MLPTCIALVFPFLAQGSAWRQYAAPEEAGFSSEALADAWEEANRGGSAAVMAVYRGHVLLAWGEVEQRYECHSVRKSLVNALIGRVVTRGTLSLEDTLAKLDVDDLQPLTPAEREATVADLLGSRSGVYHPAAKEPADMRAERPARGSHAHGEFFFYNNWDFNLLGTLYERAAGTTVAEGFLAEIARPLGMQDLRPQDIFPELAPTASRYPAHAFRMSARDLARFGELYRREGRWDGNQILPERWTERSTRTDPDAEDGRGYGYLWWTYRAGSLASYPHLNRHDTYAAIGTGGQFLLVVPGAELVFVHRADTDAERAVPARVCWALAERVLAAQVAEPSAAPELESLHVERFPDVPAPRPDEIAVPVDPTALAGLVGEYASPQLEARVFLHEGRLFVHTGDGEEVELLPLSPTRFFVFTGGHRIEFEVDPQGQARAVHVQTPRGRLTAARL